MKTKTILLTTFSLLLVVFVNAQNNTLTGNWQATNGTIMSFQGTNVRVGNDTYVYEIEGSYLSMYNQQGDVLTYTYQVKANQLYLYLEGSGTFILNRVGSTTSTNTQTGQNTQLYGNWQASNGTIMSFQQNSVSVGADSYSYQVSGTNLTMYNGNGESLAYTYQIQGNQLYLNLPGSGTYTLTKTTNNQTTQPIGNRNQGTNQVAGVGAERLYGSLCSYSSSGYSGSSSYSTTKRISFDGRGHYQYGSSSSYSGNGDGYSGGDGGYSGTYKVVGNEGVILTASDGSVYKVALESWKGSGEITGLKYDGVIYAKALCD